EMHRGSAVPVLLARLKSDAVAGADLLHAAAAALCQPEALGDMYDPAVWMGVPCRAHAWREMDPVRAQARGRVGRGDLVDVGLTREPLGRRTCSLGSAANDLHGVISSRFPWRSSGTSNPMSTT